MSYRLRPILWHLGIPILVLQSMFNQSRSETRLTCFTPTCGLWMMKNESLCCCADSFQDCSRCHWFLWQCQEPGFEDFDATIKFIQNIDCSKQTVQPTEFSSPICQGSQEGPQSLMDCCLGVFVWRYLQVLERTSIPQWCATHGLSQEDICHGIYHTCWIRAQIAGKAN